MLTDEFEWDDRKAARNLRDHGIAFETATEVFDDTMAYEWRDDTPYTREERFLTLGISASGVLLVVSTLRGERIRIISARRAEAYERKVYHDGHRSKLDRP
jgi:hypothetical protein